MIDPLTIVEDAFDESARVKLAMRELAPDLVRVASRIAAAFRAGHHLYACGNGGSACDAMHLVEELVARYKRERPGLPAHHLLDAAILTCWSNDYEFESVFQRQVEAMLRPGDILIAISTSGNSQNVIRAVQAANAREGLSVGLTGRDGGGLRHLCGELIAVPSDATERIQEGHITIIHLLCDLIERMLFGDMHSELTPSATEPVDLMIRKALTAALLCCTPVACGGDAGPSPEQIESRDIAARQACISERLATRAMDELQTLEQLMGSAGIVAFQRAYEQHASLRLAAFAQLDSALNHSATAEDSIRHDGAARRIQIRAPAAESVEDNVLRSYEANFAAIFNDSDHPCNWQSELDSRD